MAHKTLVEYMNINRNPTRKEELVIRYLVDKSCYKRLNWEKDLKVADMNDGGMGSLLLIPQGQANKKRLFKEQISEIMFKDIDGVDVIVSLNIDQDNYLFELDCWKVNYENVISYEYLYRIIESELLADD